MDPLYLSLLAIPFIFSKKKGGSPSSSYINSINYVKQIKNVPFSIGSNSSIWPIYKTSNTQWATVSYVTTENKVIGNPARAFGAIRENGARYHVGIDLYCDDGDICVAAENGTVVGIQGFLNITKALLLQTDSGIVLLYGEIKNGSWDDFNIKVGTNVKKGQQICKIGKNQTGSAMLHFETYTKGTTKNSSWPAGTDAPQTVLNPTKYLLNCLYNSTR